MRTVRFVGGALVAVLGPALVVGDVGGVSIEVLGRSVYFVDIRVSSGHEAGVCPDDLHEAHPG